MVVGFVGGWSSVIVVVGGWWLVVGRVHLQVDRDPRRVRLQADDPHATHDPYATYAPYPYLSASTGFNFAACRDG